MMLAALLRARGRGRRAGRRRDLLRARGRGEHEPLRRGLAGARARASCSTGVRHAIGEFGGFTMHVGGQRFYPIQVAEKQVCTVRMTLRGAPGHGSMPVRGGAMAKARARAAARSTGSGCRCTSRRSRGRWWREWRSALPRRAGIDPAPAAEPARSPNRVLDRMGERARVLDPILHNTVSATGPGRLRQVQRDPRAGRGRARRPPAARASRRRTCSTSCTALTGARRRARGDQARPGPARARPGAVRDARLDPRGGGPGQHRDPAADARRLGRALLRAARHPDLRLHADAAAARTSTSGPACTAPTSASRRTRSSSARTRSARRCARFGTPHERRAAGHALGADAAVRVRRRCASTAR